MADLPRRTPTGTIVYGNALSCNGTSQYAIYNAGVSSAATNNFTLSVWAYINAYPASGYATFFCNGKTDANGYRLSINSSGVLHAIYSTALTLSSGSTLSTGQWYHMAVVRDSGTTQIYLNGSAVGSTSATAPFSPNGWVVLGAAKNSSNTIIEYANAYIDDARYYTSALSSTEVSDLYNKGLTPFSYYTNHASLHLWWKCDESSGSLTDSTSSGYTGTLSGSPSRVTGGVRLSNTPDRDLIATSRTVVTSGDPALDFPGATTAYVTLKSGFIIGTETNASIAMWINTTQGTAVDIAPLYVERAASGNDIWRFQITTAVGQIAFTHRDDAATLDSDIARSTTVVNDGAWHHVAITKSGTSIVTYVDGVAEGSATLAGGDTLTNSGVEARLGSDKGFGTIYYDGLMDKVLIYNKALTAPEVATIYSGGVVSSGLIDRYLINETSGTTIADSIGSNNGTLVGAMTFDSTVGGTGLRVPVTI